MNKEESINKIIEKKVVMADKYISTLQKQTNSRAGKRIE